MQSYIHSPAALRRRHFWSVQAILTLSVAFLQTSIAHAAYILDGGFESPAISPGTHVYGPAGTPWTYPPASPSPDSPRAGVMNHSSGWPTPTPVEGDQVGFIQSALGQVGSFSQPVTFTFAGLYQLQYSVAGRSGPSGEGGNLPFTVSYGSTLITSDVSFTGETFTTKTIQFSALPGTATLLFQGFAPVPDNNLFQDNTAFFDAIAITPLPEPTLAAALAITTPLLTSRRRR